MKKLLLMIGLLSISLTAIAAGQAQVTDFNKCKYMSASERFQCLSNLSNSMLENSLSVVDAATGTAIQKDVSIKIQDAGSFREIINGTLAPGQKVSLNGIQGTVSVSVFAKGFSAARVTLVLDSTKKLYSIPLKNSALGYASGLGLLTSPDEPTVSISAE